MNNKLRIALMILLGGIFLFSGYKLIATYLEYKQGDELYDSAIEEFVIEPPETPPDSPPAEPDPDTGTENPPAGTDNPGQDGQPQPPKKPPAETLKMDFPRLAEINPDIVGWIKIEGTRINYPLLKGEDNDYYLKRAYNKTSSRLGSIFMDYRCAADFSDRHTIIYGHNMKNGAMFSGLLKYASQSYYDANRYFYIYTAEGYLKYEIFSVYRGMSDDMSMRISFSSFEIYDQYVRDLTAATEIATNTFPTGSDRVVSLVTCAESANDPARYFIHGRLVEDTRKAEGETPDGSGQEAPEPDGGEQAPPR